MPRRTGFRDQRLRYFVACEGESERGYAALLQLLADEMGLGIHLDIRKGRGGDPLAVVQRAVRELKNRRIRHGHFKAKAIFLDADRRNDDVDRSRRADVLIKTNGLIAVWSIPCIEALLLKHLSGCEHLRPATSALALRQLQDRLPAYRKGMSASELRVVIGKSHVERAARNVPELHRFLVAIGFLA